MKVVCILEGGPMRKIRVDGEVFDFEMHPFCGPTLLNKWGDPKPVDKHPRNFLEAASLWAQQGQRMENGWCLWRKDPTPIRHLLGGRHYLMIGEMFYPTQGYPDESQSV